MIRSPNPGATVWYCEEDGSFSLVEIVDVTPRRRAGPHPIPNVFVRRSRTSRAFWTKAQHLYREHPALAGAR